MTPQVVVVDLAEEPPAVHALGVPSEGGAADTDVTAARFTADSRTVVEVGADGMVRYVDVGSDVQTRVIRRVLDLEVGASFSTTVDGPENRRFMVTSDPTGPGPVTVWDVDSGRTLWAEVLPDAGVASVSPDGARLVLAHADGRVEAVALQPGGTRSEVPAALASGLVDVAWSPDGTTFAGVTQERSVLVWDAATYSVRQALRGLSGIVTQAAFSPDGASLFAASDDRSVHTWDVTGTRGVMQRVGPLPQPGALERVMSADGSVTAARYRDGRVDVVDVTRQRSFEVVVPGVAHWMFADRLGRLVGVMTIEATVSLAPRFTVHVIDVEAEALLPQTFGFEGPGSWYGAAFTWDGEGLLTVTSREPVQRWDLATGQPQKQPHYTPAASVLEVSASPDGRTAVLSEAGGHFEFLDLSTGRWLRTIDVPTVLCCSVPVFSSDGRLVASRDGADRVHVFDTGTGRIEWEMAVGEGQEIVAFTPDSRSVLLHGSGVASLWSLDEGVTRGATLEVDPQRSGADAWVGLQDDGRTVVGFTEATGLRRWDVTPDRLMEQACQVAGRNLTTEEWEGVLPDRVYERTCPEHPRG